ncbi:MAG: lytic transglycosylase domain-containing protein [Fimbriimonadaceae bacterium]
MGMPLESLAALIISCAPMVAQDTAIKIIRHESGGNPYAIGVNGPYVVRPQPLNKEQAVATARKLLTLPGVRSIDVGFGQINSDNFSWLGLTVESAFDGCTNIRSMQTILVNSYERHAKRLGPGQAALQATLSEYNTGHPERGLRNGYVRKIYMQPIK